VTVLITITQLIVCIRHRGKRIKGLGNLKIHKQYDYCQHIDGYARSVDGGACLRRWMGISPYAMTMLMTMIISMMANYDEDDDDHNMDNSDR